MVDIAPTHTPRTRFGDEPTLKAAGLEARQTCRRREVMYDALCEGGSDTACLEALCDWLEERKR
ncbi:hypothetical protein [uncultured Sulfitobacter sp.]|uniref:hypothetical protein n=1 Tax=uncultured Sulfitobacter sp. TaxID=191468 RepID=UPI0030DDC89F|tara:strand:+ start:5888 stop:6079 length:192 start_codon:yes stop_codon:yes gene_type:complete